METTDSKNNIDSSWIFPLNVYSALLNSRMGQSPWLVYGELTDDELNTVLKSQSETGSQASLAGVLVNAQRKRVDRVLSAVSKQQGSRVLEVGCGSGAMVDLLTSAGFDATGIDCQAELPGRDLLTRVAPEKLICCHFEDYNADTGFDVLIFHGSARYFSPLTLFDRSLGLLRPGGLLLICDEFAVCCDDVAQPEPLPLLDHVLALATRLGLECLNCEDLSVDTHAFQQLLVHTLTHARHDLPALTGVKLALIDQLIAELQAETSASAEGSRKHVLLSLQAPFLKSPPSIHSTDTLRLRNAAELPFESYRQVFEASFSAPFDPAVWAWKYHTGKGVSVVAERGGQALAHYGGVIRHIVYFAHDHKAVQICDVMVLPEARGFFSRNSLFFKTAASMLEQHAGYKAESLLGFGFPNIKAMHVAQRLGLYEKSDELLQIALASNDNEQPLLKSSWSVSEAKFDESLQQQTDLLWQQMRAGFTNAIIGVRDSHYLSYRFLQRPGLHYQCLKVMCGEKLMAVAFARDHADRCLLMDIIAAPQHLNQSLISILRAAATQKPCHFWLTSGQLGRVTDGADNLEVTATGIQIPCNRWSPGPPTVQLINAWWLTAGDMDFL